MTTGRDLPSLRSLWAWYRPYLRGSGRLLSLTLAFTVVTLVCQALVPLQVDRLLTDGLADFPGIAVLVALVLLQIIAGYKASMGSGDLAVDSAFRLRLRVFERLLHSRTLRMEGLVRSSVVTRHTGDVDHLSDAFDQTLGQGLPSIVRIAQSLILLTWLDWRAGLVMAIATGVFLIWRRIIGRRLLATDRERFDSSSALGESVDESIIASRVISGLHMDRWMSRRYLRQAEDLHVISKRQSGIVSQLITGANAAGLAGLVAVVVFGLILGRDQLATVAASLLYVDAIVRGLEALPGWIRSLQLAAVSRLRIDQILNAPDVTEVEGHRIEQKVPDLASGHATMIGLVTSTDVDDESVLTALSVGDHPDPWRVTLDGHVVRRPGIATSAVHVMADGITINASVREHMEAVSELDDEALAGVLVDVGLGHLFEGPTGIDEPLGPSGIALSPQGRQRLTLALGMAARPELLLIGPLSFLAEAETALPIVAALRRHSLPTVMAVRSPEVAQAMDAILYVSRTQTRLGSHEELLVASPEYSRHWDRQLRSDEVDLSMLGLSGSDEQAMYARLVTERYAPGEPVYREGDVADRIIFIISGHAEISTRHKDGTLHRVAVLGPGNSCGDLRLTVGERRAETATALDTCIVRSLSREAVTAGVAGLLSRTPTERRVVASLLRVGPMTRAELTDVMADVAEPTLAAALAVLVHDEAVRETDGRFNAVLQRSIRSGSRDYLDRLGDS